MAAISGHAPHAHHHLKRLHDLRRACLALEHRYQESLGEIERLSRAAAEQGGAGVVPGALASTRNLLHYLAMRSEDLRDLHTPLAELGLSSLGRIESHVLANLNAVIDALARIVGPVPPVREIALEPPPPAPITLSQARMLLEQRTTALLGPSRERRGSADPAAAGAGRAGRTADVRIMVTLPSEAAHDAALVRSLLHAGMTCARINTAHDTPEDWESMCRLVRTESEKLEAESGGDGRSRCRILMDLAGPKLRTGPIEPGPEVVKIRPVRDDLGRVVTPGKVVLRSESSEAGSGAEIPVPGDWLATLRPGDVIELRDTRGRRRMLRVLMPDSRFKDGRLIAVSDRTVYFTSGMPLRLLKAGSRSREAIVGRLEPIRQSIVVRPGDRMILALQQEVGRPALAAAQPGSSEKSSAVSPAVVTCTLPEAFRSIKVGDPVWFDDGKVGTAVSAVLGDRVELVVTHASPSGDRIAQDKGINLPETQVRLPGVTEQDLEVLPIVARHADMVGISFVHEAAEVADVHRRLCELGGAHIGTVLKIETRRAFENLPSLLLAALRGPGAAVMIARGDLAVEVGYERLAEVQEEILWLCEAAHLPVIWATQVLETMAKTGRPSRAEVTDAAMGERAECVMLNKGAHITEAVRFLDNLVRRMQTHQSKKRPMLRALSVAKRFGIAGTAADVPTGPGAER